MESNEKKPPKGLLEALHNLKEEDLKYGGTEEKSLSMHSTKLQIVRPLTSNNLISEMELYVIEDDPDTYIPKATVMDAITELVRLRTENDCLKQTIEIIGRKRRERNLR